MFKQRLISFPLLLFLAFLVVFSADWGPYIFMVLAVPVTLSAILESCIIARKLNLSVHWRLALLAGILIFLKYGIGAKFPGLAVWLPDLALTAVLFFTTQRCCRSDHYAGGADFCAAAAYVFDAHLL